MAKIFRTDANRVFSNGNLVSQTSVQTDITAETIYQRALAALAANQSYLASAAIPAGSALTTTQLTTIVRALRAQLDIVTRENNALIRIVLQQFDDGGDT